MNFKHGCLFSIILYPSLCALEQKNPDASSLVSMIRVSHDCQVKWSVAIHVLHVRISSPSEKITQRHFFVEISSPMQWARVLVISIIGVKVIVLEQIMDGPDLITLGGYVNNIVTKFITNERICTKVNKHLDDLVISSVCSVMNSRQAFNVLQVDEVFHGWDPNVCGLTIRFDPLSDLNIINLLKQNFKDNSNALRLIVFACIV